MRLKKYIMQYKSNELFKINNGKAIINNYKIRDV